MVQKFRVEKSRYEKFMVEKSGVERSGVEAWGWKVQVEMSFNLQNGFNCPRQILRPTAGIAVNYWKAFFQGKPQTKCPAWKPWLSHYQ